jgi:hypothetical protein
MTTLEGTPKTPPSSESSSLELTGDGVTVGNLWAKCGHKHWFLLCSRPIMPTPETPNDNPKPRPPQRR